MKKLKNQVRNELFRPLTLTLTLTFDVLVRRMDAKGLIVGLFLVKTTDIYINHYQANIANTQSPQSNYLRLIPS